MTASERERAAEIADAEKRITDLHQVAKRLWPSRDDALVMSELVAVVGALRQAQRALQRGEQ